MRTHTVQLLLSEPSLTLLVGRFDDPVVLNCMWLSTRMLVDQHLQCVCIKQSCMQMSRACQEMGGRGRCPNQEQHLRRSLWFSKHQWELIYFIIHVTSARVLLPL